jgi:hypothetical protein
MERVAMDAGKILHQLTYAEGLPREALKAASAQRAEMLPLFLQETESYLALEPAARVKPTLLFFIFHLFGEWREKAAYRPLARLLRISGHEIDAIFGDQPAPLGLPPPPCHPAALPCPPPPPCPPP